MRRTLHNLTPTSHPDLFVGLDGRLVHRQVGPLRRQAAHFLTLPDGTTLRVRAGAPTISLHVSLPDIKMQDTGTNPAGAVFNTMTTFMSDASGYIQVAEAAIQLVQLLDGLLQDAGPTLATLDQRLTTLMVEVGASDYLQLLRDMSRMRGNATAVIDLLHSINSGLEGDPATWYNAELRQGDYQLHSDINSLLDEAEAYFHRAYFENLIAGDGNWGKTILDRPVDQNGATFEYQLALPTVMFLIAVRLSMMKFTVPDFLAHGIFTAEIDRWWRRIQQLSDKMAFYVRPTPPSPINVQAVRRQKNASRTLGIFTDWEEHDNIDPPNSIAPMGAIDITTGAGSINWQYTQFDEWYLGQGDLHGGRAGYWPPSFGPQFYQPPPGATGLPPMDQATIQRYYDMAALDARNVVRRVQDEIGVGAVSVYAWQMAAFAYPGAPV
jgi:hypothetical protein